MTSTRKCLCSAFVLCTARSQSSLPRIVRGAVFRIIVDIWRPFRCNRSPGAATEIASKEVLEEAGPSDFGLPAIVAVAFVLEIDGAYIFSCCLEGALELFRLLIFNGAIFLPAVINMAPLTLPAWGQG